jgi:hypothetical protein
VSSEYAPNSPNCAAFRSVSAGSVSVPRADRSARAGRGQRADRHDCAPQPAADGVGDDHRGKGSSHAGVLGQGDGQGREAARR